jgi:hypothetical protein
MFDCLGIFSQEVPRKLASAILYTLNIWVLDHTARGNKIDEVLEMSTTICIGTRRDPQKGFSRCATKFDESLEKTTPVPRNLDFDIHLEASSELNVGIMCHEF